MISLSTTITGLKLRHPVMNASGVLASTPEGVYKIVNSGVSAVVTKTLTMSPRKGYDPPIVVPLEYGLLNAVGLANPGISFIEDLVRPAKKRGIPVIASIGGRSIEEFIVLAEKALEGDIDGLELNLSCPHTTGYGLKVMDKAGEIVESVKSVSDKPVWAKLSYSRDIVEEAGRIIDAGADALVLINTLPGMIIDVYSKKPVLSNVYGGLSGPAIHPVMIYTVYAVYREYQHPIIGVGGIVDWETALETLMAGATALQIATGFYMKGYGIIEEVLKGLKRYMLENDIKELKELVGIAHKK